MKRVEQTSPSRAVTIASAILLTIFTTLDSGARTWKDASGKFEIEAELVSADRENVALKKPDGTELTIAISNLSPADVKFVAQATDRGSHRPSSAERAAIGSKALKFLSKHRLPKPRQRLPDDELVRASVEGLALLATGEVEEYQDRIDDCRDYLLRHATPPANAQRGDVETSTRALSYALMFASEHALQFNDQRSKMFAHEIATRLLERQAEGGGWSATGITEVVNATGDGTGIALVAMAAVEKLGEIQGAVEAKASALKFLKACHSGSGIVTAKPGGDINEAGTSTRSMIAANALNLNGEALSPEAVTVVARLKKLGQNMVMSGHQKSVNSIEGESFLALLFHSESKELSAKFWDHRLGTIRSQLREDGSFPDPSNTSNGAGNIIAAFDQKAAEEYEKQEAERHLPAVIQTSAFRALTVLIPQGNLQIFEQKKP